MSRAVPAALLLFAVLGFVIANRGAYESYFSADELDNLVWTRDAQPIVFWHGLFTPKLTENNFRPVGHLWFRWAGKVAGLHFGFHVAGLHFLHLLNLALFLLILKKLGASVLGITAGGLVFGFHMAVFDAYWKPMYVFDVLCTTFCLLTIWLYLRGWLVPALVSLWMAFKAKELAAMLPLVLVVWEYLLGTRNWRRLVPFLAVSVLFLSQAALQNRSRDDAYTFRVSGDALWTCVQFYGRRLVLFPWALWLLVPLLLAWRDRRVQFGCLAMILTAMPMLLLPGRLFAAYLYLPIFGLAVMVAFAMDRRSWAWLGAGAVLWVVVNLAQLRMERRVALTIAPLHRAFVTEAGDAQRQHPGFTRVFLDEAPLTLDRWGAEAAFRWFRPGIALEFCHMDSPNRLKFTGQAPYLTAIWDRKANHLLTSVRTGVETSASYIDMALPTPVWQLHEGWQNMEGGFRWTLATADATLARPNQARSFELKVNASAEQLRDQGPLRMELLIDGKTLGEQAIAASGWQTMRWSLPTTEPGTVRVQLRAAKPYKPTNGDPRILGAAVAAFGFLGP